MESLSSIIKDTDGLLQSTKQLTIVLLKTMPDVQYFLPVQHLMKAALELKGALQVLEAFGSTSTQDPKQ